MTDSSTSSNPPVVEAHAEDRVLKEDVWTPTHPKRGQESAEFQESKHAIEAKSPVCYICGVTAEQAGAPLEGHHLHTEWSLANSIDLAKVQKDFPQYESVAQFLDSTDNLLILCAKCHRSPFYGVHMITMPAWIVQKYQQDGWDLVHGNNPAGEFDRTNLIGYYPEH